MLQIRETANVNDMGMDYNFRVFSDPNLMKCEIEKLNQKNNKSRMVAGYCWEWPKENRTKSDYHDIEWMNTISESVGIWIILQPGRLMKILSRKQADQHMSRS